MSIMDFGFNSKMVRLIADVEGVNPSSKNSFNSKMVRLIECNKPFVRASRGLFQFQNGSINSAKIL